MPYQQKSGAHSGAGDESGQERQPRPSRAAGVWLDGQRHLGHGRRRSQGRHLNAVLKLGDHRVNVGASAAVRFVTGQFGTLLGGSVRVHLVVCCR